MRREIGGFIPRVVRRRLYDHDLDRFEDYSDSEEVAESTLDEIGEGLIDELRVEFLDQFPGGETETYTFTDFLKQSVQTLQWRIDRDIPEKLKRGVMSKEDAQAAIEVCKLSIEAIKSRLRKGPVSLSPNLILPGDKDFHL